MQNEVMLGAYTSETGNVSRISTILEEHPQLNTQLTDLENRSNLLSNINSLSAIDTVLYFICNIEFFCSTSINILNTRGY